MGMMITGIAAFIAGVVFQIAANMGAESSYLRHPEYLFLGGALQVAALIFIIIGVKKYYFAEIIAELKKMNAEKTDL